MESWFSSVAEFLFKYPARLFGQGHLVWQNRGVLPLIGAAVVLVVAAAVWQYGRARAIGLPDRILLTGFRTVVAASLGICLLRPGLALSTSVPERNALGILLDDSKSMLIRDADSVTRLAVLQRIFGDSSGTIVRRLRERYALRFYRFADVLDRVSGPSQLSGAGVRTDLAGSLDQSRRMFGATPLAGIVVATDGADNGGDPLPQVLLGFKAAKVPVYTVGIGRERFERDVAIERVELPRSTLKGSVLLGSVALRTRGVGGETLALQVEDGGKIVATTDVPVPRGADVVTVPVRIPPLEEGSRRLTVSVRPLPGEAVSQNNTLGARIRVRGRREKILYLEGEIRPEFAFLRRAAAGDSNVQLVGLQRTSKGKFLRLGVDDSLDLIRGFPTSRADLFRYRGLILGSMEAGFFTADQLRMVGEFVGQRGGGLLALGSRSSFGEGAFEGTALADVLPVTFANRVADSAEVATEIKIQPTAAGALTAALMLGPNAAANHLRWDSLPSLTTVNRFTGLKPGATSLLEGTAAGTPVRPVFAMQRYGRGNAMAFTAQDSWLWRMHAGIRDDDLIHQTLWRQLLRWLVEAVPDRIDVTLSPEQPTPGQRISVRAEVVDSGFVRVNDAAVTAQVTGPDGAGIDTPLAWTLGQDGVFTGSFVAARPGSYQIAVRAVRGRDSIVAEPETIDAEDRGADFLNAEMRAPLLKRIAEETGGRFYTPATVDRLPDDVAYTESGVTVRETKDLWDMPAIFLVMLIALGGEWSYRRWRNLV